MAQKQRPSKQRPSHQGAGGGRRSATGASPVRRLAVIGGAIAVVVVALVFAVGAGSDGDGGAGSADPTAFDLPALEGEGRVRLADFAGEPVVVNFFASWCTACDFELPHFKQVSDELAGEVTFVGVNALETGDPDVMPDRHKIRTWPLASDIGGRGGDLHAALGGRGMPLTAYYDADGELLFVDKGAIDEETLRARMAELFSIDA